MKGFEEDGSQAPGVFPMDLCFWEIVPQNKLHTHFSSREASHVSLRSNEHRGVHSATRRFIRRKRILVLRGGVGARGEGSENRRCEVDREISDRCFQVEASSPETAGTGEHSVFTVCQILPPACVRRGAQIL